MTEEQKKLISDNEAYIKHAARVKADQEKARAKAITDALGGGAAESSTSPECQAACIALDTECTNNDSLVLQLAVSDAAKAILAQEKTLACQGA